MPFGNSFRDRLNQVAKKAEEVYRERISALPTPRFGVHAAALAVRQNAALENFGTILFYFIDEYSSEPNPSDFLRKVNDAIVTLRTITLESKWPQMMPTFPGWQAETERQFDDAMISWLEGHAKWRNYESLVIPLATNSPILTYTPTTRSPLFYFKDWPIASMPSSALESVKAGLLEVHGAFLDSAVNSRTDCWRRAYDLVAHEFAVSGLLSAELVETQIPEIVADASAGGGWFEEGWGRVRRSAVFSEPLGARFYPRWRLLEFRDALKGRISHWHGQMLLSASNPGLAKPSSKVPAFSAPPGAQWQELLIEVAATALTISRGNVRKELSFAAAGFGERDQRLETLKLFAATGGYLTRERASKMFLGKTPVKNRVNKLRQLLQAQIAIEGQPIEFKTRTYVCIFQVRSDGETFFPTPGGISWSEFRFLERLDGRLSITVPETRVFRAHSSGQSADVAQSSELIPRLFSLQDMGLSDVRSRSTREGVILIELLRGEGRLKRRGDDMSVLKLAQRLQVWTALDEAPFLYSEKDHVWIARFECASEIKA